MELILNDIKKSFEKKVVLAGASFTFEEGKIYGLLGRNGAGKTTLFNCINQDILYDGGTILLQQEGNLRTLTVNDIGYVQSTPIVPDFLTAPEFLRFFIDINSDRISDKKTPEEYLDSVGILQEDRYKLLRDFSHGMKNKMQMLINFIANPAILLLDEPLTSLDVVVAEEMKDQLRHRKEGHIIIFSTHILELALDLCDEIVILDQGILEAVHRDDLDNQAMKDRIIDALKGDANA